MEREMRIEMGAAVFKALAHPSRLLLVEELGERGEMCVCEMTELVGADMSTVSRHLSQLRNAGVVASEKVGNEIHYQLKMRCVLEFIECVQNFSEARRREVANG